MQLIQKTKTAAGNLFDKVKKLLINLYDEVTLHWSKPAKGNSVSYREFLNYSLGGMGQRMVTYLLGYMALSATNTLLGSSIGIRPMHLQYMSIVATVLGIFFAVLRGKWVDNTRTRWGRFRPYIALTGFPLVGLTLVFLFLPFDQMTYTVKFIWVFAFAVAINVFQPLFTETYTALASVMTANSNERARLLTVSMLIASFAPTVYNFVIPLIMDAVKLSFTDLDTYRYIIAAVAVLGVGMNMFTALGCKERVIASKSYAPKVSVAEGMAGAFKNKYWWIRNIASIIGVLESAFLVIFNWMYIYGTQDMSTYAFLQTIYGFASTIAMLITPLLLRKLGNRGILLFHNITNIILISFMLLVYEVPLLYFVVLFANTVINQLQLVYNPVLEAEVKDYQQFLTGKRVDFILTAAGQVLVPITLATSFVLPFVYEAMGLTTNYDVLYDPLVRNNMFDMLCVCSIIGATLNLIPYFFYRLSREQHRMIVRVLHRRAAFADFAAGSATARQIVETVTEDREIREIIAAPEPDVKGARKRLLAAYRLPGKGDAKTAKKEAVRAAKEEYKAAKSLALNKEAYKVIYLAEEQKFITPEGQLRLRFGRAMTRYSHSEIAAVEFDSLGILEPSDDSEFEKVRVQVLEGNDKEAKKLKRLYKRLSSKYEKMRAAIKKAYPDAVPTGLEEAIEKAYAMPTSGKEQIKERDKAIDRAERAMLSYNNVFGFYIECAEFLAESENRKYYSEIEARYEEALKTIAEEEKEAAEKQAAERERKSQELEEARRRRFESYSPEKQAKILARRERAAEREKERAEKLARENAVGCVTTGMTAAEAEKESEFPDTCGKTFEEVAAASAADSKGFEESKSGRTATEACGEKETEESNND